MNVIANCWYAKDIRHLHEGDVYHDDRDDNLYVVAEQDTENELALVYCLTAPVEAGWEFYGTRVRTVILKLPPLVLEKATDEEFEAIAHRLNQTT